MSIYKATPEKPYHLSVGAVAMTQNNKVICHYWKKKNNLENIFLLMTETINDNDSYEKDAVSRGLMEEMGIEGEVIAYIGSLQNMDKWFGEIEKEIVVEKTTLFYLVKVIKFDRDKRLNEDEEIGSELIEIDINELIEKMNLQYNKYHINFLDQPPALINAKRYIKLNSL